MTAVRLPICMHIQRRFLHNSNVWNDCLLESWCGNRNSFRRCFHRAPVAYKRLSKLEKRIANFPKYPEKFKGEFVGIWHKMTVGDLAKVLKRDLQYAEDVLMNEFTGANTVIPDELFLQNALTRAGKRCQFIARPTSVLGDVMRMKNNEDMIRRPAPTDKSVLKPRPPVVTVMGHVDHGKTTLLDALRNSRIVDREFGGITQHIGAFSVVLETGAKTTFLDTPGHAAFISMRERGANVTDIVLLVVAADDGVMEQTIESIRMAKKAKVPIMVAINKIDAPKADIDRTHNMLAMVDVHTETVGGNVQSVPISALKHQNLDKLVEALSLQADLLQIRADPGGLVEGVVIESRTDPSRGRVATIIVQRGTLKARAFLLAGTCLGRVRNMTDSEGRKLDRVLPGYPAEVDGWKELPSAGDVVLEADSERQTKKAQKYRLEQKAAEKQKSDEVVIKSKEQAHRIEYTKEVEHRRSLGLYRSRPTGPRKPQFDREAENEIRLNVLIKADVDGSLEAILDVFATYDDERLRLDVIDCGVGPVTTKDVEFAQLFHGIIYAFNVDATDAVQDSADMKDVTIKLHNVIYKMIDDIKDEMNVRLPVIEQEEVVGHGKVLETFKAYKGRAKVSIAGCRCTKGQFRKNALYKVIRDGDVVHSGPLSSLRQVDQSVSVIITEQECGLQLADTSFTFQKSDELTCFIYKKVQPVTNWSPGF